MTPLDQMTLRELDALPTVSRLIGPVLRSFVAANGVVWDAGLSGHIYVKAWNRDPPPAAAASVRLERPKRA